jgi:hypothetical protein
MFKDTTKESTKQKLKGLLFSEVSEEVILNELKLFKSIMDKNNFSFFLIGGCCLGIVRDGKLLNHDKDIDIGILDNINLKKLKKVLSKYYDIVHITGVEHGKILWVKKNINNKLLIFEIQVHYRKDNIVFMNRDMGESFNKGWRRGRIQWDSKYFTNFDKVVLGDEEYNIPSPASDYLTIQHGDWETPKQYIDWRYNIKNLFEGWL